MAFYKVRTDEESVRDFNGNKYIMESDIYEVVVKYCVLTTSPNGSKSLNLYVMYNNQLQPIFNAMRLTNNDGSENLGFQLFNKFCIVAGGNKDTEVNDPETMQIPIGKNGEMEECSVLTDFNDIPMFIRIQMQYRMYNGEVKENKVVRNFYRYEDKATASEIVNNSEKKGEQYEKDKVYAKMNDYKDGLTEEDINTWKKNRNSKNNTSENKPKPSGFTQKKFFGKKS